MENKDFKCDDFENEEKNYYKPVKVHNFWHNNYIQYESKGDKNKAPSVEEYLNEIGYI